MLRTIAVLMVALVATLLLYAASRPDTFHVYRSVSIHAPAEKIFPLINDLRAWRVWAPYENLDPAMHQVFSGAASGPGAVWAGNSRVGQGRIEITDSVPSSRLGIRLDIVQPIEGHHLVQFTLQAAGDVTQVTWAMQARCLTWGKSCMSLQYGSPGRRTFRAGARELENGRRGVIR